MEGITDMNMEIKQTIDKKPIEISGDGKYDKNKRILQQKFRIKLLTMM